VPHVSIDDLNFYDTEDRQVVWHAGAELKIPDGGTEKGKLMVCLDVDGQMDIVYADLGRSGDLASLDRAIAAMQHVRNGLAELYAGRNDVGTCFEWGDWGRCCRREGHDGVHRFPTEARWRSLNNIPTVAEVAS
jgi:hypothetical protein